MIRKGTTKLGDRVKDKVTGMVGIIIARSEHLNGCIRCGVKPVKLKDGAPQDCEWMDEPQLTVIKGGIKMGPQITGGPKDDPPMKGI